MVHFERTFHCYSVYEIYTIAIWGKSIILSFISHFLNLAFFNNFDYIHPKLRGRGEKRWKSYCRPLDNLIGINDKMNSSTTTSTSTEPKRGNETTFVSDLIFMLENSFSLLNHFWSHRFIKIIKLKHKQRSKLSVVGVRMMKTWKWYQISKYQNLDELSRTIFEVFHRIFHVKILSLPPKKKTKKTWSFFSPCAIFIAAAISSALRPKVVVYVRKFSCQNRKPHWEHWVSTSYRSRKAFCSLTHSQRHTNFNSMFNVRS